MTSWNIKNAPTFISHINLSNINFYSKQVYLFFWEEMKQMEFHTSTTKFFAVTTKFFAVKVNVSETESETEEGCRVYKRLAGN